MKNMKKVSPMSGLAILALAAVACSSGESDVAFFMNPTLIDQVRRLAEKGIRLPQKATFFYPKLLSGLVINKFGP